MKFLFPEHQGFFEVLLSSNGKLKSINLGFIITSSSKILGIFCKLLYIYIWIRQILHRFLDLDHADWWFCYKFIISPVHTNVTLNWHQNNVCYLTTQSCNGITNAINQVFNIVYVLCYSHWMENSLNTNKCKKKPLIYRMFLRH